MATDRSQDPGVGMLEIASALPPEAVLAALGARDREWRESLMPPALRAAGYYGVRVRRRGARFRVWLKYSGRAPLPLVLAGVVRPIAGGHGAGCTVTAGLRRDRGGFAFAAAGTALWTLGPAALGGGGPPCPAVAVLVAGLWIGTTLAYLAPPGAGRAAQVAELWAVVRRAAGVPDGAPGAEGSAGTPNEALKLPGYAGTHRDAPRHRLASALAHPRHPSA
ncbi:hypothetical protein tb265_40650 [Gemmatimonadetes bacterium T265]|nr:hypothetical protein tb265_40650 [Gemmatimonadetes bacterium T265]